MSATPTLTLAQRREHVQQLAASNYKRRVLTSRIFLSFIALGLFIALIPLASILQNVIGHGYHYLTWSFLTQPQSLPSIMHQDAIGGIANALSGTVVVDLLAVLISIPLGIILAIGFYENRGRWAQTLLMAIETLIGLPSILFGVFIYIVMVSTTHVYQAIDGSLALTFVMAPVIALNALAALQSVPQTIIEAGLSLGSRPSKVMLKVVLPIARPRIFTGIFLAFSRAVGETAPVLFVIGASNFVGWSATGQATTLPTMLYQYLTSSYPSQREACWGIALVLLVAVLLMNLASRLYMNRAAK